MVISSFFKDVLGAELNNIRNSWGAVNQVHHTVFLRTWEDQNKSIDGRDHVLLLGGDWKHSLVGYRERVRHVGMLRAGWAVFAVYCTAEDPNAEGAKKIRSFDDKTVRLLGEVIEQDGDLLAPVLRVASVQDLQRPRTAHGSLITDLRPILRSTKDTTTREVMAAARVGQGDFRKDVLALWGGRCCVTGIDVQDALRASHIRPWRDSDSKQRLDPYNGLPLVATLDALFDAGLITFSLDGVLKISGRLSMQQREDLGICGLRLRQDPHQETAGYLAYHRQNIFVE